MSEASKAWRVVVDGAEREIELDHGTISGKRVVTLDGVVVIDESKWFDTGSSHVFDVDGHPAEVRIDVTHAGLGHDSSLHIDGRWVEPLER